MSFTPAAACLSVPPCRRSIYLKLVDGHLQAGGFPEAVARMGPKLVDATIDLHRMVMHQFLPTSGAC